MNWGAGGSSGPVLRDLVGAPSLAQRDWRRVIFDTLAGYTFWLALIYVLILLAHELDDRGSISAFRFATAVATTAALGAAAWARRVPMNLRTLLYVAAALSELTLTLFRVGFLLPNVFVVTLLLVCVVALTGVRWHAYAVIVAFAGALAAAGWHFVGGAVPDPSQLSVAEPKNWARIIIMFLLPAATIATAIRFAVHRMEEAVARAEGFRREVVQAAESRYLALEEKAQAQAQMLESQKLEALGRLSAAVAHDFNNLLVVISGNASLLRQRVTGSALEDAEAIEEAAHRAASMTKQLLAFGRQGDVFREPVYLDATVRRAFEFVQRLLPARVKCCLELNADGGLIECGGVDVDQILMNLCVNARDAMPEGGTITVSTERAGAADGERHGAFLKLVVRDTGAGIPQEVQERLFEPFFTTKSAEKGTGLGLSVVQSIAAQLGGFVEVDSTVAVGSTFSVYIPEVDPTVIAEEPGLALSPPSERSVAAEGLGGEAVWSSPRLDEAPWEDELESSEDDVPRSGRPLVLLVEPDPMARGLLQRALEGAGYRCLACSDGQDALDLYDSFGAAIDVVMSDCDGPGASGADLVADIEARGYCGPLVFCGASAATAGIGARYLRAGRTSCSFLQKPFDADDLLTLVDSLTGAPQRSA